MIDPYTIAACIFAVATAALFGWELYTTPVEEG